MLFIASRKHNKMLFILTCGDFRGISDSYTASSNCSTFDFGPEVVPSLIDDAALLLRGRWLSAFA